MSDFVTHGLQPCQASVSSSVSWSLLKVMPIESMMLSNHLILCCPPLLLPSVFLSIRVFSKWVGFASGGRSIGALALTWVLPMNIPLGLIVLISLQSKECSRVFSSTTIQKYQTFITFIYNQMLKAIFKIQNFK